MKADFMFTSESVTEGHPDKLCDIISDAVLDEYLVQDPASRVVTECAAARGIMFIASRFSSTGTVDIPEVARRIIQQVGYRDAEFNPSECTILTSLCEQPISQQTADEADLDDTDLDRLVAKQQATVFGFACDQTPALMPLPVWLAHRLARRLTTARLALQLPYLSPDGKTQVGVVYRNRHPERIHSITVITSQNQADTPSPAQLREDVIAHVIEPVFRSERVRPDHDTRIFVNPEGPLVRGGPPVHSGLTGRKTAIDTYGEYARHSGAALSGKDPSRIDRVGAYAARHAAKNVVAAGLATACELQLSYTIGLSRPVSIQVETFGTGVVDDSEIARRVERQFDFRPGAIARDFQLRHLPARNKGGFYRKLAAYGQVGRTDMALPWESVQAAEALAREL